jgi:hypothetical protein
MGNGQAVNIKSTVTTVVPVVPYLNHALFTFRPVDAAFLAAFIASEQTWMYQSPATLEGLVAELTGENWQSRLKSLGANSDEPIWKALDAHFNQVSVADAQGIRARLSKPDAVYIGRRTSAVVSQLEITFTTNDAGRVRVKINPAKYIYSANDPTGSLADVTVVADGVLTPTQLATALAAALNALPAFTALFSATPALGVVTIASLVAGYPLMADVLTSTPGPTVTQEVVTANVANAYRDDLFEMQEAAETGAQLDPPTRKWYWIHDLQLDDVVNAEGMAWVENEGDVGVNNPILDYQFVSGSSTGNKSILFGADLIGNFDSNATDSASQVAQAANGGLGWSRSSVHDHDRAEYLVPALLGRTIGFLPGQVSFTSKVLFGQTASSRISGRDYADAETLSFDRSLNWYSAEGPNGSAKWGYLSDGSFMDRKWLEDYATYLSTVRLTGWMQLKDIVEYSDDDIIAGAGQISAALATIPAINASTITVSFLTRAQVPDGFIAGRIYNFFVSFATTNGVINRIGTLDDKIQIFLADS